MYYIAHDFAVPRIYAQECYPDFTFWLIPLLLFFINAIKVFFFDNYVHDIFLVFIM